MSPATPRVIRALVALVGRALPAEDRDAMLGDLLEQQADEQRSQAWLFREACALAWGLRRPRASPAGRLGPLHRLDIARQDFRQAIRALLRARGVTLVAIVTLTLGIGLTTAVYSLVEAVLIRPLPYPESDRIVRLAEIRPDPGGAASPGRATEALVSATITGQLLQRAPALQALSPVSTAGVRVLIGEGSVYARAADVGPAFFEVFPASPSHGRLLGPDDALPGADTAVVASEAFWRSALHGRPDAVGMRLVVGGEACTLVGVLPGSFAFPARDTHLWRLGEWRWPEPGARGMIALSTEVVARLAGGASVAEAEAQADAIALDVAMADDRFYEGTLSPSDMTVERLRDAIGAKPKAALIALMAGVGCVLLLACVNLAILLLARGSERQRELAVRAALGGSRFRVIRPALFENLVIAASGGALGLLLAWSLVRMTPALIPEDLPRWHEIHLRLPAVLLASGLSAAVGIAFGLLPVLQVPARHLRDALGAGRAAAAGGAMLSADRMRSALVVVQIAVTVVLLIGAGLLGRSLARLLAIDTGYKADSTLTFQIETDDLWRDGARQLAFYEDILDRLASHAAVEAVGYSTQLPLLGGRNWGSVSVVGDPPPADRQWPRSHYEVVSPGYFKAAGMQLLEGRLFTDDDDAAAEKVAIVSDEFARRHLGGRPPVGLHLQYGRMPPLRVVGVVRAKRNVHPGTEPEPEMFSPLAQVPPVFREGFVAGGFAVRTSGDPLALVPFVRTQARAVDPLSPPYNFMTLEDRVRRATAQPRFYAATLTTFSLLAFVTAMVGVYGVLAYAVERRRLEFGIRRALGADTGRIVRLVAARGIGLTLAGLVIGLAAGAAGMRLLQSLLFDIQPGDPATFAGVAATVTLVAAVACVVPARRATSIPPTEALKLD